MKISYNWLKQFIQLDWEAEKTGTLLTDLGLEIEGIEPYESVPGGLKGVVVGHVLECTQHPNADRLKLTKVDIGGDAPLQIVCGAPNVAVGQKVPVATVGTTLYGKNGEALKIKKGKIRGEESHGMICAEDELGLGESHDGIMVLNSALTPGISCSEVFEIESDQVFEIGLTPNRADAMSHFGVARDLKAGLLQQELNPELITPSVSSFQVEDRTLRIDVQVKNNDLAPRYCGLTISGVKVKPSPSWLQNRLKAIGLSPINNIVDATNYVLHELGQPLHAFDAHKISGGKIEVKTLPAGTKFITLDEVERTLHEDDLMICDEEKPMCIAGVFGGIHSGVTETTTAIFLESAYFNPVSIRKTAKRHGLSTDASFRFERGIDITKVDYALQRAALLIQEVAGGKVTSEVEDIYPKKFEDFQVFLTFEKVNKLIGQEIPKETIKSILTSLEIKVNNVTESGIGLTIPNYRVDVRREADVIEEILRVYGYNKIAVTTKLNTSISHTSRFADHKLQNLTGDQLVANGFYEIMGNSLTTPHYDTLSEDLEESCQVAMLNPLSSDLSVMRQSLLFTGLEAIAYNLNRKQHNLKLFEFGKTYKKISDTYEEQKRLSLFLSGNRLEESWTAPNKKSDFFYMKGLIQVLLERFGLTGLTAKPATKDIFSEGLSWYLGSTDIVSFGKLKPHLLKDFDIKQDVLYADFNWEAIGTLNTLNTLKFKPFSKYPEVRRDLALLVDESVSFEDIYNLAKQTERKLLKSIDLFDVYQGKKLPEGKKSYAVSFILLDENQTLTDRKIEKCMQRLQQQLEKKLGIELR